METVMASGFTSGKTIRDRMALPPGISLSSLILPVLPLVEQSLINPQIDKNFLVQKSLEQYNNYSQNNPDEVERWR
jgi:hypothetical protein